MPRRGPLHWVDGQGWLVLLGGGSLQRGETDVVDSHILSVANLDRPLAVLWGGGSQEEAEAVVEHYAALGGPGGEALVLDGTPCHTADFLSLLAEAGILYLGGENPLLLARSLQNTPVLKQSVKGFATLQGLLIVGAGGGAAALGAWVRDPAAPGFPSPGLNFLRSALVAPHFTCSEEAGALRDLLQAYPGFVGLGIPDGTALALGPRGQVETWGKGEVTAVVRQSSGQVVE
ncbi:MAG: Type 1 glutamine amidotransferase-like domain-containing protein [Anaerolineae bacterium]|nr:Type 1 glutamine amidotransferase-like domain-containing protein [Anaerolineae bacterium]